MAAMSATSIYDDRPNNGWAAPKIRQPKIGLGDDDVDGAEKHGLGLGLGQKLGPGLVDILMADFRWRCGSAEARRQRDPTYPPTAPISTTKGSRPTLSTSDISPIDIHHPLTAHVRDEYAIPHQHAGDHTIAHRLLQSSRLDALLRRREGRWDAELLGAAENPLVEDCDPPPPYDNEASDVPPPYTLRSPPSPSPPPSEPRLGGIDPFARSAITWNPPMTTPKPDWNAPADVRQRGKKKKNTKKGEDNWGSGDEGKKDGGIDEKNNGGDDAGDGAAGGAGAGAGAGGGDDGDGGAGDGGGDDEWNFGKKKKKGKKGKAAVEEEEEKKLEEERKMKEQEEEDERKKKEEEEEATAAAGLPAWSGGGDADPGDEWGGFAKAEKKGKNRKKGKAAEEEERKKKEEEEEKKRKEDEVAEFSPTADPLSWADTNQVDTSGGWGGFTTTEKRGKKGKKGNEEAEEKKKTEEAAATKTNAFSWADDDPAEADSAWATINTNDKKGKKGKKSKVRAEQFGQGIFTIEF